MISKVKRKTDEKVAGGSSSNGRGRVNRRGNGRVLLIGGFLGAGKTTFIGTAAKRLGDRGSRPGIITNDQGDGLVDTALGEFFSAGEPGAVKQVTGGCFCCRADALVSALDDLAESHHPDVYLIEPVGSCTDLMATVLLPLREIYGREFDISPMAVVIDAVRAEAVYASRTASRDGKRTRARGGRSPGFSKEVRYIYGKQLEEAEVLVLNKVDLLSAPARERLRRALSDAFPEKRLFEISAREGTGCDEVLDHLLGETSSPPELMAVDYDEYAEGEAKLGWYNSDATVHATGDDFDADRLLLALARAIQSQLESEGAELAHFKMSLKPLWPRDPGGIAVVNAVRNGAKAELSQRLGRRVLVAELLVNLRAEAPPATLQRIVAEALAALPGPARTVLGDRAAFRPGRPEPQHRITTLAS